MNYNPLNTALDNAVDNIRAGNYHGTKVSLLLAEEIMKKENPTAFESAKKFFDSFWNRYEN